jgi:hypothetical protein
VFVDVIPASAVLYIINFANCYQNGPPKARKLLVFLVNYAHYATLFIMKRLCKGCSGSFGTHSLYLLVPQDGYLTSSTCFYMIIIIIIIES